LSIFTPAVRGMGTGHHRQFGDDAGPRAVVTSKIPDYGCPFAPEKDTVWAIIAERVTKVRGLLLHRRVLMPTPSKEGALWGG
jgi:hypothetical protein